MSAYELNIYIATFLTGLISSLHCVGMCGSIQQLLLSFNNSNNNNDDLSIAKPHSMWFAFWIYHIGRLSSYLFMALVASLLIYSVRSSATFMPWATIFRAFAGLLMIFIGLSKVVSLPSAPMLENIGLFIWKKLQRLIRPILPPKNILQLWLVGVIWGWLPCGLVYSAAGLALSTASVFSTVIAMILFGLATIPAFVILAFIGEHINKKQKIQKNIQRAFAIFLITLGLYTLTTLYL